MNALIGQVSIYGAYLTSSLHHSYLICLDRGSHIQEQVTHRASETFAAIQESSFWTEHIAPTHERYIDSIKATEWKVMGGALLASTLVVVALVSRLGIGALPLASGTATTIIMSTYYWVDKRAERHFKICLNEPLKAMQTTVAAMTASNYAFAPLHIERNKIKPDKARYFPELIKEIDSQIAAFRQAMENPAHPNKEDAKQCFLLFLERTLQEIPA